MMWNINEAILLGHMLGTSNALGNVLKDICPVPNTSVDYVEQFKEITCNLFFLLQKHVSEKDTINSTLHNEIVYRNRKGISKTEGKLLDIWCRLVSDPFVVNVEEIPIPSDVACDKMIISLHEEGLYKNKHFEACLIMFGYSPHETAVPNRIYNAMLKACENIANYTGGELDMKETVTGGRVVSLLYSISKYILLNRITNENLKCSLRESKKTFMMDVMHHNSTTAATWIDNFLKPNVSNRPGGIVVNKGQEKVLPIYYNSPLTPEAYSLVYGNWLMSRIFSGDILLARMLGYSPK